MCFLFLLVTQLRDNCVGGGEKCGGLFGCLGFKLGFHSFFVALISSLAWGFRRFNHTPFFISIVKVLAHKWHLLRDFFSSRRG